MNRALLCLWVLFLSFSLYRCSIDEKDITQGKFFTGTGTSSNPFRINTPKEMALLATLVNAGDESYNDKHYILLDDIDLSSYHHGQGWVPIGETAGTPFKGTFEGNHKKITGLTVHTDYNTALFGVLSGGTIQNLGLEEVDVSGKSATGSIVGFLYNGAIANCYITGTISGKIQVGGVAGGVSSSTISDCYTICIISGEENVGGLAGFVTNGNITNCYATGEISGKEGVGGLAGAISRSSITNCAALNPSVRAVAGKEGAFGRITGLSSNSTLNHNVAWDGMQAVDITFQDGEGANHVNGADISATMATTATFWITTTVNWEGWNTQVWSATNNKLPVLRNASGNQTINNPPLHLQQ